jgi:hypothetical protein
LKPAGANSSQNPIPKKKKKTFTQKKGLVEWLKMQALSSNPSTTHKQQQKGNERMRERKGSVGIQPHLYHLYSSAYETQEIQTASVSHLQKHGNCSTHTSAKEEGRVHRGL